MRVRILDLLRDRELSVNELAEQLSASQQNVSKHLVLLVDAGMLARRKDGTRVYYRIADESVFALCEQVCGSCRTALRPRRTRRHNHGLTGRPRCMSGWRTGRLSGCWRRRSQAASPGVGSDRRVGQVRRRCREGRSMDAGRSS